MAKAVVVAAPGSGSGKTLLVLGLLRALRHAGLKVASAKVGPDYIDPGFHMAASAAPCFNLDPWAMPASVLKGLLRELARDKDLIVIEGVMGLFDGSAAGRGSTAELAALLNLPVVLTVDASHQAQSVAALVHGFATFRPGLDVAGVVLNRVRSERHRALLCEALGARVLGTLRHDDSLSLPSRHLGLVQAEENQELETFIETAASAVARETVLDRILAVARQPADESDSPSPLPPPGQHVTVARDRAFSFAYPHLLHAWQRAGASLSFFSPLADEAPDPAADLIFLPGGYPELHAGQLSGNGRFLEALRRSKAAIYGECGGFMVLGDGLIDGDGRRHAMAGLLPLVTSFADRRLSLGYRRLLPRPGAPWALPLAAHEFHYSTTAEEGAADRLFDAADAAGQGLAPMGLRRGSVSGSFAHVICAGP